MLPKESSIDVYTTSSNDLTSNERVNITNWHKAYPTSKEINHVEEQRKSTTLIKKIFSKAPKIIRMQFENISLDQRNVLELHFLLNLINRYKWNIAFIILILIIIIVNVYYKFKIFETIVQTMINYKWPIC